MSSLKKLLSGISGNVAWDLAKWVLQIAGPAFMIWLTYTNRWAHTAPLLLVVLACACAAALAFCLIYFLFRILEKKFKPIKNRLILPNNVQSSQAILSKKEAISLGVIAV